MTRSLAEQSVDELGGPGSVLARQRRDHVELDELLTRLRTTSGPEQDEVLTRVCRLVFSHAFAEESVLWPAVRAALPDGERLTLQIEQEHQAINEVVSRLETLPPEHPERPALIDEMVDLLQHDVRGEEDELLPRLQEAVDVRTLRRLGRSWELVRRTSPTRPHPRVARRPPGNALAGLPLTVLDRSRDLLDALARRVPAAIAPVPTAASRALAGAAAAVEHLGPVQRGEDPSTRPGPEDPSTRPGRRSA